MLPRPSTLLKTGWPGAYNTWTLADISTGIDLPLAMIEEDLGVDVSRTMAQKLVVYRRRSGGQSQFSALLDMEPESNRFRSVLTDMRENLALALSTESLATIAYLSLREFGRAFIAETGETPAKAVEPFEQKLPGHGSSAEPIEVIARSAGSWIRKECAVRS